MTFLAFVAHKLMGPPICGSCWRCPFCDPDGDKGASFSVRPPLGDLPIKWKCFRCDGWGDEFDLVKHFHPSWGYDTRKLEVLSLMAEFKSMKEPAATPFLSGDRTGSQEAPAKRGSVALAFADLTDELRDQETGGTHALQILKLAKAHADDNHVALEELMSYWDDGERRVAEFEAAHLVECSDPACDYICCRLARGEVS